MAAVLGLRCVRCGTLYSPHHFAEDCAGCRPAVRSNLEVVYYQGVGGSRAKPTDDAGYGLWRYGDLLPVDQSEGVSLGEGGSPLHRLTRTAAHLDLEHLYGKDETRNPTWSFKDRLACIAVSSAKKMGAPVIVSSSSGNAGAAAAAYAAKAGLRCVIFTFKGTSGPMVTQMRAYGADVIACESKDDRWTLMEHAVRNYGWFPTSPFFGPVVGSNPYGIEGYKTLAYEIAEQLNWKTPDWCILPVCYGDALLGMWRGFQDMISFGWIDRMPRMVAAEVYGSLSAALAEGADTPPDIRPNAASIAVSINASRGTYQALDIIRKSGGAAVTIGNEDLLRWQDLLSRHEGLFVEASTAAAMAAVQKLTQSGKIEKHHSVVSLLTASGLKDPATAASCQGEMITLPVTRKLAMDFLKERKIFPR
ncbi:pyridoxal-phosphate dependent enzyme [Bradyrhizobium sp. CCBAU 21359]|uniref:pyridoxal-phosphate dependent enzyme n=1 Tax=Bradyrhizobium sp. CCBAU 21359 TaxID=1325080 RepID=UPI00230594B8|nr:pyridoxal-phosphate dependent enzyme [Bradyrhizobium sp. CCBAU 21359]